MTSPKKITVTLNVAHVGRGGNSEDGQYFYSSVPQIINVTESDTPIEFVLAKDSQARFSIKHVFCTDAYDQISLPEMALNGKSIEMTHANNRQCLIFFSILAYDEVLNKPVNCDPQATNVPPG